MVNKPKRAGTAAETAVAVYLALNGWPYAERRSLAGALDKGDITGTPGICWEVKSTQGDHSQIAYGKFLREAHVEKFNAKANFGIVVVKPKGRGSLSVNRWVASMYLGDLVALCMLSGLVPQPTLVSTKSGILQSIDHGMSMICPPKMKEEKHLWHTFMHLEEMVGLLHQAGYGSPESIRSTSTPATGLPNVDGAPRLSLVRHGEQP